MKSEIYWKLRAVKDYAKTVNETEAFIRSQIAKMYAKATEIIQKDIEAIYTKYGNNNSLTLQEAKKQLSQIDLRKVDFESLIELAKTDETAKAALEAAKLKSKITRLELLEMQTQARVASLYDEASENIQKFLHKVYEDGYYRTLQKIEGVGFAADLTLLNTRAVDNAILQNWSGKNFCEKIWGHKQKLGIRLRDTISTGLIRGYSVDKMSSKISKDMGVSFSDAKRLVRTESNYCYNKGTLDGYIQSGIVESYKYLATLDNRTSPQCRALDGEVFEITEAAPGTNYPPMHPNCRSTTVPYFDDLSNKKRRARADDKSYLVPAETNYEDWRKGLTPEQNKTMDTSLKMQRNKKSDKTQFDKYKSVLGINSPKSFADFQELKYNDENWKYVKVDYSRRSKLINNSRLALPYANKAEAAIEKFEKYLFNPENKTGFAKGEAFTSRLGYNITNSSELRREILNNAENYPSTFKREDNYGKRYEQKMILYGKTNNPTNVIVGWNVNDGETKLTSAYIKEVDKNGD